MDKSFVREQLSLQGQKQLKHKVQSDRNGCRKNIKEEEYGPEIIRA
jgi:hypothetical protein